MGIWEWGSDEGQVVATCVSVEVGAGSVGVGCDGGWGGPSGVVVRVGHGGGTVSTVSSSEQAAASVIAAVMRVTAAARSDALARDPGGRHTAAHLSTSPTTKNIEPRIATMSAMSWPGSISESTETLLKEADRSLRRHGVLSPRETR